MHNYLVDANDHILVKIPIEDIDNFDPDFVKQGDYDLIDLILTHLFNDYRAPKYKWLTNSTYDTNAIVLHAIEDAGTIRDVKTTDIFTDPTGPVLTEAQASALIDSDNTRKYKVVSGDVSSRTAAEKLTEQKNDIGINLKKAYLDDVLWTDDAEKFYNKWKNRNPSNTDYDDWFEDIMVYWHEARTERDDNKAALNTATTITAANTIIYNPTHNIDRSALEK